MKSLRDEIWVRKFVEKYSKIHVREDFCIKEADVICSVVFFNSWGENEEHNVVYRS